MTTKIKTSTIKISPIIILTLIFINLKLMGIVDWTWLWVFSPVWLPWVIVFSIMIIYLFFLGITFLVYLIIK
jgi:hypothetical protein